MKDYIVLYRIKSIMSDIDDPFVFHCIADDCYHAHEQCLNAYPDADIEYIEQLPV